MCCCCVREHVGNLLYGLRNWGARASRSNHTHVSNNKNIARQNSTDIICVLVCRARAKRFSLYLNLMRKKCVYNTRRFCDCSRMISGNLWFIIRSNITNGISALSIVEMFIAAACQNKDFSACLYEEDWNLRIRYLCCEIKCSYKMIWEIVIMTKLCLQCTPVKMVEQKNKFNPLQNLNLISVWTNKIFWINYF